MRILIKRGFSMLEMVFVIVIVGILSKFGVELFLQTYEGYNRSLVYNTLSAKTEAAILQIGNRLSHRIRDSIIVTSAGGATTPLSTGSAGNIDRIEWVGREIDMWRDGNYSGVIDLGSPAWGPTQLRSPGTTALPTNGAIMFVGTRVDVLSSFGWNGNAIDLYVYDPMVAPGTIPFNTNNIAADTDIFEFYVVAESAYWNWLSGQ